MKFDDSLRLILPLFVFALLLLVLVLVLVKATDVAIVVSPLFCQLLFLFAVVAVVAVDELRYSESRVM